MAAQCLAVICAVVAAAAAAQDYLVPPSNVDAAPYAEWAHHHWVWLAHGGSGQADMIGLFQDYQAHKITVGAIDIDSTWETGFDNFVFDKTKFPNATEMVETCHAAGVRVIMWITSMVDVDSPNYKEGYDNDYYIKAVDGKPGKMKWWHGTGSLVDYTNPAALQWWHKQMDVALATGIDGWKCDGTDPYIMFLVEPRAHTGPITPREYSDQYYGDFFNYTRSVLGNDRLIMSRPVDAYGPVYHSFSPKYVMLSGWVGDEDDTYVGLEGTLKRYLQSAWAGYANFGSDIGGYRAPQNRTIDLFLRWAGVGAFSPLMENGGDGEHRPWLLDSTNFTTDTYRRFVNIHYALVPYLLSVGSAALGNGTSALKPLAKHESFIDKLIDDFQPSTYDYLLGDNVLVAPVTANDTATKVVFPKGEWAYWFNTADVITGDGKPRDFNCPLSEFPAFHRVGAITPLNITEPLLNYGDEHSNGVLTALVVRPQPGQQRFVVRQAVDSVGQGQGLDLSYTMQGCRLEFRASAHARIDVMLLLHGVPRPAHLSSMSSKTASHIPLKMLPSTAALRVAGTGAHYDHVGGRLFVRPGSNARGSIVAVDLCHAETTVS